MNHTTTNRAIPVIVILTPNTLMSIGLRGILEVMLPFGIFKIFTSFEEIESSSVEDFFHLFVSANIIVEHGAFFEARRHKTIALTQGSANATILKEFHQINILAPQAEIEHSIKSLHHSAHGEGHKSTETITTKEVLSPREIEVTKLLIEGLINKEIAQRLSISTTTVITHRKNIFEKLGIRSVAGLAIYSVMKGYLKI